MFLGDLFDGGREWSTSRSESPIPEWHKYGDKFWLEEYARWCKVFLQGEDGRPKGRAPERARGDRRYIASLPGNHDLGISGGVQIPVRERFEMHFGEGNRVDVIGNHSFVSVDTVSLLAKMLSGPDSEASKEIWGPANKFLDQIKTKKAQSLERELRSRFGKQENDLLEHTVLDMNTPDLRNQKSHANSGAKVELPDVLITHVPMYRSVGTPCGPLREKYPPSPSAADGDGQIRKDDRNSIRADGIGYQYRNVLDPHLTSDIVERIGNVRYAFSGDDHDYCDVVHREYTVPGGIREITVKSMSWAMGVRKPGFLLVSLWNPIDEFGSSLTGTVVKGNGAIEPTIQTKLCLLPDQLGIFIAYGILFAVTTTSLLVHSFVITFCARSGQAGPILPLAMYQQRRQSTRRERAGSQSYSSSKSSNSGMNGLSSRGGAQSLRTNGYAFPGGDNGGSEGWTRMPSSSGASDAPLLINGFSELMDESYSITQKKESREVLSKWKSLVREFARGLAQVGALGFLWYCWLAYTV